MHEQEVFVENLSRLINDSPWNPRQIAEQAGVGYGTLNRWVKLGIHSLDEHERRPLQRLCQVLDVRLEDLWRKPAPDRLESCLDLVTELVCHWESTGCDRRIDALLDQLAGSLRAARVVTRFLQQEPDLTEVVVKVKTLSSQDQLREYLESLVSQWGLEEEEAFRRLIESTRRFLCATLPDEPAEIGRWFQQAHPGRWARLLEQNKLDGEGEAFAFVRHMMAEGLSPLEAYEALIRLSDQPVVDV